MKNIIITGVTDMMGGLVLKYCLAYDDVQKIVSISRRPTGIVHNKLVEIIESHCSDLTAHKNNFNNMDIAFFV